MEDKIIYDFNLSRRVIQELEEEAICIENGVIAKLESELQLLAESWQSDSTDDFMEKLSIIQDNLIRIKNNILLQTEQIKKISKHMYLIEQEGKITATEDSK